jgi:hypothetical protein
LLADAGLDDEESLGWAREAPGLSAGSLLVAHRQVTLKPPSARITPQRKKAPDY